MSNLGGVGLIRRCYFVKMYEGHQICVGASEEM